MYNIFKSCVLFETPNIILDAAAQKIEKHCTNFYTRNRVHEKQMISVLTVSRGMILDYHENG
jgi:hypothetical protein